MSTNRVILSDMPAVEGLIFRSICGEEDAAALCAVHTGRSERDQLDALSPFEDLPNLEEMRAELARVVEAREQHLWLLAQVDEQVVGYTMLASWAEEDGRWVYLIQGWVLPEWRGRGIGSALLHWGEQTSRQLAAAEHPGEPFEFAANASSTEQDSTTLLLNEGYFAGYTVLEMGLDISIPQPELPLPPGMEVRLALPEHCALIAACIDEAYRNEFDNDRYQESFDPAAYADKISAPKHDPTLWKVAWAGDQIVGQVLPRIMDGQAEVFEVSVLPAWRRKGLARALLTRALQGLRDRGIEVIRLRTVAEFRTRASDLYRSVGFRVLKEYPRYRKAAG